MCKKYTTTVYRGKMSDDKTTLAVCGVAVEGRGGV